MKPMSKISNKINLYRPLLDIKKKFLIKITKNIFKKYFKDPSNNDYKYLRTKVRNLKKPLEKSGIEYEQIIKSINNLASSKTTLDGYFRNVFEDLIKSNKKQAVINLIKFKRLNNEVKIAVINESIKKIKNNYYNPRSKKVDYLINIIEKKGFKKATLGGCIFIIKDDDLCIKLEKT